MNSTNDDMSTEAYNRVPIQLSEEQINGFFGALKKKDHNELYYYLRSFPGIGNEAKNSNGDFGIHYILRPEFKGRPLHALLAMKLSKVDLQLEDENGQTAMEICERLKEEKPKVYSLLKLWQEANSSDQNRNKRITNDEARKFVSLCKRICSNDANEKQDRKSLQQKLRKSLQQKLRKSLQQKLRKSLQQKRWKKLRKSLQEYPNLSNSKDENGDSPAHHAARYDNPSLMWILAVYGGDLMKENNERKKPQDLLQTQHTCYDILHTYSQVNGCDTRTPAMMESANGSEATDHKLIEIREKDFKELTERVKLLEDYIFKNMRQEGNIVGCMKATQNLEMQDRNGVPTDAIQAHTEENNTVASHEAENNENQKRHRLQSNDTSMENSKTLHAEFQTLKLKLTESEALNESLKLIVHKKEAELQNKEEEEVNKLNTELYSLKDEKKDLLLPPVQTSTLAAGLHTNSLQPSFSTISKGETPTRQSSLATNDLLTTVDHNCPPAKGKRIAKSKIKPKWILLQEGWKVIGDTFPSKPAIAAGDLTSLLDKYRDQASRGKYETVEFGDNIETAKAAIDEKIAELETKVKMEWGKDVQKDISTYKKALKDYEKYAKEESSDRENAVKAGSEKEMMPEDRSKLLKEHIIIAKGDLDFVPLKPCSSSCIACHNAAEEGANMQAQSVPLGLPLYREFDLDLAVKSKGDDNDTQSTNNLGKCSLLALKKLKITLAFVEECNNTSNWGVTGK